MSATPLNKTKIIIDVTIFALSQVALYYGVKYALNALDPLGTKNKNAKLKSAEMFKRLGIATKDLDLNEHEQIIASEVVHPDDISVSFKDIGGLDPIISSLKETVIYPLVYPQLFTSEASGGLLGAPKGVLLYGPPGTGKTMLAKALATESRATFINLPLSTLTEKYFGESQKLVRALFTFARKVEPCIVFIDEIDSFLRERRSADHEATSMMKAEFMSQWDGLSTTKQSRVLIMGATNRPNDIDKAILRRMPKRFEIGLPNDEQRDRILRLLLKNVSLSPNFSFQTLVARTSGLSGSDLKELCRSAAMTPVREAIRGIEMDSVSSTSLLDGGSLGQSGVTGPDLSIRPLELSDFFQRSESGLSEASVVDSINNPDLD
ncbi:P-loop containing nucleoside triphosphate hydrolase protein [Chytriomyces cf. hyalinus JEL632]|nr:P-loop containing nucleoside triphosphate hydrolase protein [Chytriomyces cf. hyalinus JEL632]